MAYQLSRNERFFKECISMNHDEVFEYILSHQLTVSESKLLLDKLGIQLDSVKGTSIPPEIMSIQTSSITPTYKKKHAGIFKHYISTLEANPYFDPVAVASVKQSVQETRLRMSERTPLSRRNSYGLVVGRIQSGKTAHLIGTVLHALDSNETKKPYDTVIILSGLIDDLRTQTRDRFYKVLSSFNGVKNIELLPGRENDLNSSNIEDNSSFKSHLKSSQHDSRIFVVKKNHKILENILSVLSEKPHYNRKKFLIIDDEADHASMDTNAEHYEQDGDIIDENPSLTNELLRKIILLLSGSERCWYIGYTATPYANLIMNAGDEKETGALGLPLYPRDFLHALPKPVGHLDNEFYFSTPIGHNHVVITKSPKPDTDDDLKVADDLFHRHLLTQILKRLKGLDIHHTTLVHTDVEVSQHYRYVQCFNDLIKGIRSDKNPRVIAQKLGLLLKEYDLEKPLRKQALDEINRLKSKWSDLLVEIRKIQIVEVNRRPQSPDDDNSQDLNYNSSTIKRSYIAVGGTRLSRGLTLEGLTTTWFTRSAQTPVYDTMLQMARWCGYRNGYADLVKIFTTSDIRDFYQHITMVEKEVRLQIEILPTDSDPMETLIWIKEHSGMQVTAKMPSQVDRKTWGEISLPYFWSYETPYFGNNPGVTAESLFKHFKKFVGNIGGGRQICLDPLNGNSSFKYRKNVKNDKVKQFLKNYIDAFSADNNTSSFVRLKQIFATWDEHMSWNVGVHTPSAKNVPLRSKVRNLDIGLIQRTTDADKPERFSIIQTGNEDVDIDLSPGQQRSQPLLLLYLINPDSMKGPGKSIRVFSPDVSSPAIGIGISFPKVMIGDGGEMIARFKGA